MTWPAFIWTASGTYAPGSNPWNGQPLATVPSGTFFTPDTDIAAEDMNYILGQITTETQYLFNNCAVMTQQWFLTGGTWTCPAGVTEVTIFACGGGGGGAGGCGGADSTPSVISPGGSGGAGAMPSTQTVRVVPGQTYTIVIGAGGTAGTGGTHGGHPGNHGGDGGATQFKDGLSNVIAQWAGGAGGQTGAIELMGSTVSTIINNSSEGCFLVPGAEGPARLPRIDCTYIAVPSGGTRPYISTSWGCGGASIAFAAAGAGTLHADSGAPSIQGGPGGAGGTSNPSGGDGAGGGGGGGGIVNQSGGGGFTGAGGAGGLGGGSGGGTGSDGGNPPENNTGAGGGGGGAGACNGSGNGGPGGTGGAGSAGVLALSYVQYTTNPIG